MQELTENNDFLNLHISITASPVVILEKSNSTASLVPEISSAGGAGEFAVNVDAAVQYESLNRTVNAYMAGKRFNLSEGLFAQHIIVKKVNIAGNNNGIILLKADFAGSFNGTAYFNGKPVYNADKKILELRNLEYDLQTKNILLKTAKWLFAGKIETTLKKVSHIDVSTYLDMAQKSLNTYLNQEWTKGIHGSGALKELQVVSVQALSQHLLIRTACTGELSITVSKINSGFHG